MSELTREHFQLLKLELYLTHRWYVYLGCTLRVAYLYIGNIWQMAGLFQNIRVQSLMKGVNEWRVKEALPTKNFWNKYWGDFFWPHPFGAIFDTMAISFHRVRIKYGLEFLLSTLHFFKCFFEHYLSFKFSLWFFIGYWI